MMEKTKRRQTGTEKEEKMTSKTKLKFSHSTTLYLIIIPTTFLERKCNSRSFQNTIFMTIVLWQKANEPRTGVIRFVPKDTTQKFSLIIELRPSSRLN